MYLYVKIYLTTEEEFIVAFCYETEIGLIFKDKLKISTDAITWKGHTTPLDTISGVRWGRITYGLWECFAYPYKN